MSHTWGCNRLCADLILGYYDYGGLCGFGGLLHGGLVHGGLLHGRLLHGGLFHGGGHHTAVNGGLQSIICTCVYV